MNWPSVLEQLREALMNEVSSRGYKEEVGLGKRVVQLKVWGNAERSIPSEERTKIQDLEMKWM